MEGKLSLNHKEYTFSSSTESGRIRVTLGGQDYTVEVEEKDTGYQCRIGDSVLELPLAPEQFAAFRLSQPIDFVSEKASFQAQFRPEIVSASSSANDDLSALSAGSVTAFMPGNILRVLVKPGDHVHTGDVLLILEAMKMENEVKAPLHGIIEQVTVSDGKAVNKGEVLVMITPGEAPPPTAT